MEMCNVMLYINLQLYVYPAQPSMYISTNRVNDQLHELGLHVCANSKYIYSHVLTEAVLAIWEVHYIVSLNWVTVQHTGVCCNDYTATLITHMIVNAL